MNELDVLLVHANASGRIYQSLSKDFSAIEPPIWAALLAQGLRVKGKNVAILDAEAERLDAVETANRILNRNTRLVAIVVYGQQPSASTQNMTGASILLHELKKRGTSQKTILIGLYPSALPEKCLAEEPVDFACQGEGLYTLLGLIDADLDDYEQLQSVPGLWYRQGDETFFSGPAGNIPQEKLEEELPGMAWDLLPMEKYRTSNWHAFTNNMDISPFAAIYTSLGCPYKCSFCCINAPFGGSGFRYWSPEFMLGEFDKIAKMGIRNIKIADEMFVLKAEHYLRLCELIIEKGYDFNIWAYARIDTVKERYLGTLKKAGINWLALGIESGVTNVRKNVTKGRFEDVNIKNIIMKIHDHGISVIGNFIFGLPDDTIESMEKTYQLSLDLDLEMVNYYSCMAYPGSALYAQAVASGESLPDSYAGYSQHSYECRPLPTKYVGSADVLRFRDEAFVRYFSSEKYQNLARERFGQETVDNVHKMLQHTLKRRLLGD